MTLTDADLDLVVESLRSRGEQRQRAASLLSAQLTEIRQTGKDVRSGAVKVVDELALGQRCRALADAIEAGTLKLTAAAKQPATVTRLRAAAGDPSPAADTVDTDTVAVVVADPDKHGDVVVREGDLDVIVMNEGPDVDVDDADVDALALVDAVLAGVEQ